MRNLSTLLLVLFLVGCDHATFMTEKEKYAALKEMNVSVNRNYYYREDDGDVWLTPEEFYASGYGDCEDFAIAKCHELDDRFDNLKILIAKDREDENKYHAVLLVEDYYVLDNNRENPYSLREFKQTYEPVVYLNDCGRKEIAELKGTVRVNDHVSHISNKGKKL